jgi:hypothetical protein
MDSYPEEVDAFIVSLKSTLMPENQNPNSSEPLQASGQLTEKKPKKRDGTSSNSDIDDGSILNLEATGGLEMLGDELLEDSLWEEGILRSKPDGVRSGQAVLDALNEIDGWSPIETGYNPSRLKIFLRYPKLWVRLSALAFAMKAKAVSEQEEGKLARIITLKFRDNPTQITRFLKRYERKDPELFQKLSKRFSGPSAPAVNVIDEPVNLEFEEEEKDAS